MMVCGHLGKMTVLLSRRVFYMFVLFLVVTAVDTDGQTRQASTHGLTYGTKSLIVLTATFSASLVVGGLWCYCMSAVCNVRQGDQKRGRLSAVRGGTDVRRSHYARSLQRPESPTSSTSSMDRSSPIP